MEGRRRKEVEARENIEVRRRERKKGDSSEERGGR